MARLANPTYDEVFKYLMADNRVCRAIIGSLLGKKIVKIKQRRNDVLSIDRNDLRLMRLDFNAEVLNEDGTTVEVCVELQRAQEADEVMRFRRYLATQYSDDQNIDPQGRPLHIVTIYILGHNVSNKYKSSVLRVSHIIRDKDGVEIETKDSIEFVDALTNDMIVVQIPRIVAKKDTLLDKILNVFKQAPRHVSAKTFEFKEDPDEQDADMVNIIRTLERAAGDPQLIKRMDMEDELVRILENAKNSEEMADKAMKRLKEGMEKAEKDVAEAKEQAAKDVVEAKEQAAKDVADAKEQAAKDVAEAKEQAAKDVADAKEQAAKAEKNAADAQAEASKAEEKANKAEEKANKAEEKLQQAEQKTKDIEAQLIANNAKLEQLMDILKAKGLV